MSVPVEWEGKDMKRIEAYNNFSIFVYTLYKEKKKYYVSLARKGGKGYRHFVPILLIKNRHATLMMNFDTFMRRYTRTKSRLV